MTNQEFDEYGESSQVSGSWFSRIWVWGVLILFLFGLLYGLTYWGYHSSRLPYWFDNFVQEYGIWRIYGVKTYGAELFNDNFFIDPRLESIKLDQVVKEVEGSLFDRYTEENGDEYWVIAQDGYEKESYEMNITERTKTYAYKGDVLGEDPPTAQEMIESGGRSFVLIEPSEIPGKSLVMFKNGYSVSGDGTLQLKETYYVKVEQGNFK
ncbi:MAG: hypothetical protein U9Q67_01095 [Patescibacteria group bacterium]|nr:hypothetical protein [Patescibacteria group bacterium]